MKRHGEFLHTYRKPLAAALVLAFGWWLAQEVADKMGKTTLIYIGLFLVLAVYVGYTAGKSTVKPSRGPAEPKKSRGERPAANDEPRPSAREHISELEAERDALQVELAEERAMVSAMTAQIHPDRFE